MGTGAVEECCGRGRPKGLGRLFDLGEGRGRESIGSSEIEMVGTVGAETQVGAVDGSLMIGTVGAFSTSRSGMLIVGTTGAEVVDSRRGGFDWRMDGEGLGPSHVKDVFNANSPSFASDCFGLQCLSKLTIGLPGLSLTTVGEGNLGLRSFIRMLVADLISSPRISIPFFDFGLSALIPDEATVSDWSDRSVGLFCM